MVDSGCLFTIKSLYHQLSVKEQRIANYIVENRGEAVHPSIDQLAQLIGVSESTLVRFARKLGYSGYQKFRIALATETLGASARLYEIPIEDGKDVTFAAFDSAISTLSLTKKIVNSKRIQEAAKLMCDAQKIPIFGLGGSHIVALDAFHKFIRTGIDCICVPDYHMQLMIASQLSSKDVALVFSHSGTNIDTISLLKGVKENNCKVIVITSTPHSLIGRLGDLVFPVQVASSGYISEAFSARLAQMVIVDTLYIEIIRNLGDPAVTSLETMRNIIAQRKT